MKVRFKASTLVLCVLLAADTVVSTTVFGKIRHTANLSQGDDTEAITHAAGAAQRIRHPVGVPLLLCTNGQHTRLPQRQFRRPQHLAGFRFFLSAQNPRQRRQHFLRIRNSSRGSAPAPQFGRG